MSTLMGLDVGDKRVGVALCPVGSTVAFPLGTFERAQGRAEGEILAIIKEQNIKTVVVGLPLDNFGNPTAQSAKVETFVRRLEKRATIQIVFQDEWGSSEKAAELQRVSNRKTRKSHQKQMIDAHSAAVILQDYIQSKDQLG